MEILSFEKLLNKKYAGFDQKVGLTYKGVKIELSVQGERAVGQIFEHFPLALLNQKRPAEYQIQWIDSEFYNFTKSEWADEDEISYRLDEHDVYFKKNFLAIKQDSQLTLIAPYEPSEGFMDFLNWLLPTKPATK